MRTKLAEYSAWMKLAAGPGLLGARNMPVKPWMPVASELSNTRERFARAQQRATAAGQTWQVPEAFGRLMMSAADRTNPAWMQRK